MLHQTSQLSLDRFTKISDENIDSRAYEPHNLANVFCDMFGSHYEALVSAFCDDIQMFDYLCDCLPDDVIVDVLNAISLNNAMDIMRRHSFSHDIYSKIDPLLYVVKYFQSNDDIHNINMNLMPRECRLNFVLECKEYLTSDHYKCLLDCFDFMD